MGSRIHSVQRILNAVFNLTYRAIATNAYLGSGIQVTYRAQYILNQCFDGVNKLKVV